MNPSPNQSSLPTMEERKEMFKFSRGDFLGAIRGEKVPQALGAGVIETCLVRGIRHQTSIALTEQYAKELHRADPMYMRAVNARRIMSNRIDLLPPSFASDEIPYCIWYPDLAEESTYRALAVRYPELRYQVARACAVAHYNDLYRELDILPEVHVGEEARESGVAEEGTEWEPRDVPELATLLSEPLPKHLPIIEKDLLIQMAAYHGNVERYSRLRRPRKIRGETACLLHGILHHAQFARWVVKQPDLYEGGHVPPACHARLIMKNILSSVNTPTIRQDELPYQIWYPDLAAESTYRALYDLHPCMASQILRACIVGQYYPLFEHVLSRTSPDEAVLYEAKRHFDLYFHARVAQRIADVGGEVVRVANWKRSPPRLWKVNDAWVPHRMEREIGTGWDACNSSMHCTTRDLDFMTCVPEEWKRNMDGGQDADLHIDYVNWPPGWTAMTTTPRTQ
ncbi:uncharacterized protein K489DRAFT_401284 [Dissoconium aciculare CBS 342.82]|uniref:Uncharacterized protein n=1 Tax=Dissoconium aciculare CBS 342.82 TaxID=1314786 RepID=A0A6J3M779_9PEZI|nr:uncharacterized protein K489DRAFT_401284 [Dissoconium aciculare CBS 342.82]KAF1822712.1 hypothetical protein K489DRAFT_401284 [Dissoconium aciculare CBS 342.82]